LIEFSRQYQAGRYETFKIAFSSFQACFTNLELAVFEPRPYASD
jgi:hypothetical protein